MLKFNIFKFNIDNNVHISVFQHWVWGSILLVMEGGLASLISWNLQTASTSAETEWCWLIERVGMEQVWHEMDYLFFSTVC